jgi:hypothetical protein
VTAVITVDEAALPGLQRGIERAALAVPRESSLAGVVAQHRAASFHPEPPARTGTIPPSSSETT